MQRGSCEVSMEGRGRPPPPLTAPPNRRERSKVPYIVRQCVEEVEKRGIEEVGIYRISGVATDIQALKAVFDASECGRPCLGTGGERALRERRRTRGLVHREAPSSRWPRSLVL